MSASVDPITLHETIHCKPVDAFSAFIDDFNQWYPAEYTWSQNGLEMIVIEPGEGGRCYERGPNGFELDWGRVVTYQPPELLTFTWQISAKRVPIPDAENAGQVTIRFEPDGDTTKLTLKHEGFANYVSQPAEYREALAAPQGWPYILDCFKSYCD